jgi:hypothetical protein
VEGTRRKLLDPPHEPQRQIVGALGVVAEGADALWVAAKARDQLTKALDFCRVDVTICRGGRGQETKVEEGLDVVFSLSPKPHTHSPVAFVCGV